MAFTLDTRNVEGEQWYVVKVVSAPTLWEGQVQFKMRGSTVAITMPRVEWQHRLNKAMVRWLVAAGTAGLDFTQAIQPSRYKRAEEIKMWADGEADIDPLAAEAVRLTLALPNGASILWDARVLLRPPINAYPVNNYYRAMVTVEFPGILYFLQEFGVSGAGPALGAWGSVQDRVIQFADMAAGAFVRSLSDRPLTESDVRVLLESEEVLAMRGVLAVVLTHVLAKVVTLPDDIEVANLPLFAFTPQALGSLIEGLPDEVRSSVRETAGGLVGLIADFDFFEGLERKPVEGWIDERLPPPAGELTAREVLMAVFTGSSEVTQAALFGEATLLRWQAPQGGQQRAVFQRSHPAPAGGLTTLGGTDGLMASTADIARGADEVARKARKWSRRWGGVRVAAQIFSAAHGDPTHFENDLYLGADGRLWERNETDGETGGVFLGWRAPKDVARPTIEPVGSRPVPDLMQDAASLL
ncbi:hypothetical protein AB0J84_31215, partial [Micromonospora arborensis]|uniref:hypothetical protein n=1 Tax=Micromonospora arborensis TaxID=2116518 RepID=UPI0034288901